MREELTELQRDALTETINIGVGRASRALGKFAQSDVAMSVPIIIQTEPEDFREIVSPGLFTSPDVFAVARRVAGLEADVVMIFQGSVQAMAEMSMGGSETHVRKDPREEAAIKIGGLLIESCLDQMEHVAGRNIERDKLSYFPDLPRNIFGENYEPKEGAIVIKIDIKIARNDVTGHLLCAMNHKAANRLARGLDELITESAN